MGIFCRGFELWGIHHECLWTMRPSSQGSFDYRDYVMGTYGLWDLNHRGLWTMKSSSWVTVDYVGFPMSACKIWGLHYKGLWNMGPHHWSQWTNHRCLWLWVLHHGWPELWGLLHKTLLTGDFLRIPLDYGDFIMRDSILWGPSSWGPADYRDFIRSANGLWYLHHRGHWIMGLHYGILCFPQRGLLLPGLWTMGISAWWRVDYGTCPRGVLWTMTFL